MKSGNSGTAAAVAWFHALHDSIAPRNVWHGRPRSLAPLRLTQEVRYGSHARPLNLVLSRHNRPFWTGRPFQNVTPGCTNWGLNPSATPAKLSQVQQPYTLTQALNLKRHLTVTMNRAPMINQNITFHLSKYNSNMFCVLKVITNKLTLLCLTMYSAIFLQSLLWDLWKTRIAQSEHNVSPIATV